MRYYYKKLMDDMTSVGFLEEEYKELGFTLKYTEGEWISPKIEGTKLFVFDSLENARNFDCGQVIYKCKVKNPTRQYKMFFPVSVWNIFQELQTAIKLRKSKKKYSHLTYTPPKGTIYCDAVKLVERVF